MFINSFIPVLSCNHFWYHFVGFPRDGAGSGDPLKTLGVDGSFKKARGKQTNYLWARNMLLKMVTVPYICLVFYS